MRISELKQSIKDKRLIAAIKCVFWQEIEFRSALEKYKSEPTDDAIYELIKNVFVTHFFKDPEYVKEYKADPTCKALLAEIKSVSKSMYGDVRYWTRGTAWETYFGEADAERDRRRELRLKRLESLEFLYAIPEIKRIPDPERDIVYLISRSAILYPHVISLTDTAPTLEDLYSCLNDAMLAHEGERLTYYEAAVLRGAVRLISAKAERGSHQESADSPSHGDEAQ